MPRRDGRCDGLGLCILIRFIARLWAAFEGMCITPLLFFHIYRVISQKGTKKMAIGYLQVKARTAQEAVPLDGVRVRVLDDEGNALYDLVTDESGETQTVPLETVDRRFSLSPGYLGMPYVRYSVTVKTEGFAPETVTGIPIFDGETAMLPVAMVPLEERQDGRMRQMPEEYQALQEQTAQKESAQQLFREGGTVSVGPPAVAMDTGRDQQGTSADRRVLRQVVIPDPITVHLGAPDSYAANVRVPFLDYVKNAAGSEIYPTWPEAALKANIYAIMTFALNRVYTEWYRGKGYDFDITNSTAYDQYYVPGRPIYDSISDAVDEVYGEYVRRQGQYAPYFTSFCNGSTVTCPGLSQWGTVSLADQGYTPLQILRYYYPNDVGIAKTNAVTGALSSYPGTALRQGSSGLNVQTVQTWLNRIRRNYPAIPAITDPSGTFGESTRAAVMKFQSIFGLTPDGIVGKATWYELSDIYTAVTRLAELDSEGTALGIGTVPPDSVLRQGDGGQDVLTLQYLLNMASRYDPSVPAPAQDGVFGSETTRAVIAFQQAKGLTPDGIVGAGTWRSLYDTYLGIGENVPVPEPGTVRYTVKAGDSLWLIAQRYGTTVSAIRQANGLTGDVIRIGQTLRIPVSQGPYVEYTVRAGDTLWELSRRYGTTVEAIRQVNGLTGDMLQVGQTLRIPVGG